MSKVLNLLLNGLEACIHFLQMSKLETFVGRTRTLIQLEKDAEVEKAKEEMQQATEESRCVICIQVH